MTNSVYLAGPITGLTYVEAALTWRSEVTEVLESCGIHVRCPLRGKEYLINQGKLEKQYLHLSPLSSPQGIVRRDFNDVKTCDLILVNFLGYDKASIGTTWEIGAAYALQKPVVVVMEPKSIHDHPFITQSATYVFDKLDDGVDAVLHLFNL